MDQQRSPVILAPITITPTKALGPSHVRYLLALDLLIRATAAIHPVDVCTDSRGWPWLPGTGVSALCAALSPDVARRWLASASRTYFLAGAPARIRARYPFDHVDDREVLAWRGPTGPAALRSLRGLLKPLAAAGPLPETARRPLPVRVDLLTFGVRVERCLIDLHHAVAEATLRGLIAPADRISVWPCDRITDLPDHYPVYGRIVRNNGGLRARAVVWRSTSDPSQSRQSASGGNRSTRNTEWCHESRGRGRSTLQ